jgi:hypothetical protein
MEKIRQILQGKKTYISAAALALVAIVGWWLGAVDNTNASALLCAAGALAGLGAKSQRTAEAVLDALQEIKYVQQAHAEGKLGSPEAVIAFLQNEAKRGQAKGINWLWSGLAIPPAANASAPGDSVDGYQPKRTGTDELGTVKIPSFETGITNLVKGEPLSPISPGDVHIHVNGSTSPQLVKDIVSAVRAAQIQSQTVSKS